MLVDDRLRVGEHGCLEPQRPRPHLDRWPIARVRKEPDFNPRILDVVFDQPPQRPTAHPALVPLPSQLSDEIALRMLRQRLQEQRRRERRPLLAQYPAHVLPVVVHGQSVPPTRSVKRLAQAGRIRGRP
jgi:hypothetical protein